MNPHRRHFCAALTAAPVFATLTASGIPLSAAWAQGAYPSKPLSVVVPFAPGGNTDIIARMIGKSLGARLDTNIVVDNRAGAGGNIGAAAAARAKADGYTTVYSTATTFAINPHIYNNMPFDPIKDFTPVAVTIQVPVVLVVSAQSGIKSLEELQAHLKANTGASSYGSNGNGTSSHIACHVLARDMGVPDVLHVPYKQGPQVLTDLAGGQLTFAFDAWSVLSPHVKSGRLVALAVSGKERLEAIPDVPTAAEKLGNGYDIVTWNAFCVPTGTPPEHIATLKAAIDATMAEPELSARLINEGVPPYPAMSEADTLAFFKSEFDKWGVLVKEVGADATN